MAKKHRPSTMDVLKYGPDIAKLKASMPRKKWQGLVAYAQSHGHTVAGQLSGLPDPLKERTTASLRNEAQRTVAASYKPVMAELDRRSEAAKFLEQKRASDDAAYRTWLTGETDKLDAQARAADATLATQQHDIASDLNATQQAAHADSLARVAQAAGNVSDPSQSTALDQSAADQHSRDAVANQRQYTADVSKIGSDADQISKAALLATAAVREATRSADNYKTMAGINADRQQAVGAQAKDTAGMFHDLQAAEVTKAQSNRESALAGAELGVKQASLAQQIKEANRNYALANKKFNLAQWTAKHADLTNQAKIQLGYDQIKARHGQAAADRALKKWVEKYKASHRQPPAGSDKHGITSDERKLYRQVETVRGLIVREHQRGTDPSKIRQKLRKEGFDDSMISLAEDLRSNNGVLSAAGRAISRRLGILHPGYFWSSGLEPGSIVGGHGV